MHALPKRVSTKLVLSEEVVRKHTHSESSWPQSSHWGYNQALSLCPRRTHLEVNENGFIAKWVHWYPKSREPHSKRSSAEVMSEPHLQREGMCLMMTGKKKARGMFPEGRQPDQSVTLWQPSLLGQKWEAVSETQLCEWPSGGGGTENEEEYKGCTQGKGKQRWDQVHRHPCVEQILTELVPLLFFHIHV